MAKYYETRSRLKLTYTAFRIWVRELFIRVVNRGRFARFDIDRKLEKYLDRDGGYFVELGANDGILASNTYHLEYARGWSGVLVEPAPNLYLKCLKERGKRSQVFCNACVSFDYKEKFVEIVYLDSMSVGRDLETDIDVEQHTGNAMRYMRDGSSYVFGAQAKTLNAILREANAPKVIDFLSLDVEGAEIEVLKGVDLKEFSFRYMLIECRDIEAMRAHLGKFGYREEAQFSHHDYLFKGPAAN